LGSASYLIANVVLIVPCSLTLQTSEVLQDFGGLTALPLSLSQNRVQGRTGYK